VTRVTEDCERQLWQELMLPWRRREASDLCDRMEEDNLMSTIRGRLRFSVEAGQQA
jgi:hypothetical protein